jgi:hypothetical protein
MYINTSIAPTGVEGRIKAVQTVKGGSTSQLDPGQLRPSFVGQIENIVRGQRIGFRTTLIVRRAVIKTIVWDSMQARSLESP